MGRSKFKSITPVRIIFANTKAFAYHTIDTTPDDILGELAMIAMGETVGRYPLGFEIRDHGVVQDLDLPIKEFGFPRVKMLFIYELIG